MGFYHGQSAKQKNPTKPKAKKPTNNLPTLPNISFKIE